MNHDRNQHKAWHGSLQIPQTMTWTIMMTQKELCIKPNGFLVDIFYTKSTLGLILWEWRWRPGPLDFFPSKLRPPPSPAPKEILDDQNLDPSSIQIIPASTISSPTLNIARHNADKHSCCNLFHSEHLLCYLGTFLELRNSFLLYRSMFTTSSNFERFLSSLIRAPWSRRAKRIYLLVPR